MKVKCTFSVFHVQPYLLGSTTTLVTTTPALSTTPSLVNFWSNWSNWNDYNPSCYANVTTDFPRRHRFRSCKNAYEEIQPNECGGIHSDTVEIQKQEPTDWCESIFNNTDRALKETKMKIQISMRISEPWSDELTDTNSAPFEYLSQLYARAILNPLQNVRRIGDLSDSTALSSLHSSWKILFYSVRVKSFSKVTHPVLSRSLDMIEAIFDTTFDVLAAADEDNDSQLTWNAQKELIKGVTTDIKQEIDEKLSISDTIEGGHMKFVSDVKFQKAELEDVFLQECDSNYVNMENSCEKTCALTPCQDSQIFFDFFDEYIKANIDYALD